MSKTHNVVASFYVPLSHQWEWDKAGFKKPKKRAIRAALHVVIWPTLKRFRKGVEPPNPDVAKAMTCSIAHGKFTHHCYGLVVAEVHLVAGWTSAAILAHELDHAAVELQRYARKVGAKDGRSSCRRKLSEVSAYRIQRLTETIGEELHALGLSFLPAAARTKPLKIGKGGCRCRSRLEEIAGQVK